MMIYGIISPSVVIIGSGILFIISSVYVYPFVINLNKLTHYVNSLAEGKSVEIPDLKFLNNTKRLSSAIINLHNSWQEKELKLNSLIEESKILLDSQPEVIILIDNKNNILKINKTGEKLMGKRLVLTLAKNVLANAAVEKMLSDFRNGVLSTDAVIFPLAAKHIQKFFLVNISRFESVKVESDIDIILSLQDITIQVKNEQALKDFIANASHELRTPVTTITTITETIKNIYEKDKKQTIVFLDLLQEQGERLKTLVNSLLSLSKLQSINNNFNHIDILSIVKSCINRIVVSYPERKNLISLIAEDEVPKVKAVESEISQVVDNLIINAIKYSKPKTPIKVVVNFLDEKQVPKKYRLNFKKAVTISVTDIGVGIAKEHISRLTERFYRVSDTSEISGTGLGLTIVNKIIEKHSGKLEIKSKIGQGSTFLVYLPC